MLAVGLSLHWLEQVLSDDSLGRRGQGVLGHLETPVSQGRSGRRHASTGATWGQYRHPDK